jgi:hypothetical protein
VWGCNFDSAVFLHYRHVADLKLLEWEHFLCSLALVTMIYTDVKHFTIHGQVVTVNMGHQETDYIRKFVV